MPKFECLTTAAGRWSFRQGDEIELSTADAKELVDAGALRSLEADTPQPKAQAKQAGPRKAKE